jgi:predicted TIM-barrel fold metal-dependent hydrolase
MTAPDYRLIDCDNHYYEADDCFTRHIEPRFRERTVRVDRSRADGIGVMMLGPKRLQFFSAAVGDHVAPPGAMVEFLRGDTEEGGAVNLNPVAAQDFPQFIERGARLAEMDRQGVEAAVQIPTLGVGVEWQMRADPDFHEVLYPSIRSFNRWLAADWGWGGDGRIFCTALMSLADLPHALEELERLIAEGVRLVLLTTGPVNGRSPADPYFDPFWARVQEAGLVVVFHIGATGFNAMQAAPWGEPANPPSHRFTPFNTFVGMGERTIIDQIAALIFHNLPDRFPGLRMLIVEYGAAWLPHLLKTLDKIYRLGDHRSRWAFGKPSLKPSETFQRQFRIVPFFEDDIAAVARAAGVQCVLHGSDYPHPEGLHASADMLRELGAFSGAEQRRIMRGNAAELLGLAP